MSWEQGTGGRWGDPAGWGHHGTASSLSPHSYTYGKPVQGKVQADLCFSGELSIYQRSKICTQVTGQVSVTGTGGVTGMAPSWECC